MGRYEQNKNTISRAFTKIGSTKDRVIQREMGKELPVAMKFALNSHDDKHQMHKKFGDNYGWVLAKDNKVLKAGVHKEKGGSTARSLLDGIATSSGDGYHGFVMAEMNNPKPHSVRYEASILNAASNYTQSILKFKK